MSCGVGISNYERKKQALINVNLWKSNFISLWEQYGTFRFVDGVKCFDYYDIAGAGEGQERMSKHLKQPTLWQDTQDDDLDWVHLIFNLSQFVWIEQDGIDAWLDDYKAQVDTYEFDRLVYVIENNVVTSHAFYLNGVAVDDPFLNHLSLTIAERKNLDKGTDEWGTPLDDFSYDEVVTAADVKLLMNNIATFTDDGNGGAYVFDLPFIALEIATYLMEAGIGTDLLDQLAVDGVIIAIGNLSTGAMEYALPVDVAKKMNGFGFVKLIEAALDFHYQVDRHWYDFFVKAIGFIFAAIAAYFGFYGVAVSLFVSTVASKTNSQVLKVLAAVVSLYSSGVGSLAEVGAGEAVSLLLNVYGLYVEMSYKPEKTTDEEVVDNDQEMFYRAPYSAYSDLYCYKSLTSVSVAAVY